VNHSAPLEAELRYGFSVLSIKLTIAVIETSAPGSTEV